MWGIGTAICLLGILYGVSKLNKKKSITDLISHDYKSMYWLLIALITVTQCNNNSTLPGIIINSTLLLATVVSVSNQLFL